MLPRKFLLAVTLALLAFDLASARRRRRRRKDTGPYKDCGGKVKLEDLKSKESITSPLRPHRYPNNAECEWEIEAPKGTKIRLEFVGKFSIQRAGRDGVCTKDYVDMFDEDHKTEVAKVCGRDLQTRVYISHSNVMYVKFVSDGRRRRRGFEAELTVMEVKAKPAFNPYLVMVEVCATKKDDGTTEVTRYEHTDVLEDIYKKPKYITSPNYPSKYSKNTDCVWGITVQRERLIKMTFLDDFHLQEAGECEDDIVSIYNKIDFDQDQELAFLCGADGQGKEYKSKSNQLTVRFHSDGLKEFSGFKAALTLGPEQVSCGDVTLGDSDEKLIASPNYPHNYPEKFDCIWKITSPKGTRIRVKFERDFDIEFNDIHHCTFDYVKILNGLSPLATKSNEITTLCGNVEEFDDEEEANKWLGPYDSKSNTMTIHFHSDDHYTERGFKGSVTVIKKDEL